MDVLMARNEIWSPRIPRMNDSNHAALDRTNSSRADTRYHSLSDERNNWLVLFPRGLHSTSWHLVHLETRLLRMRMPGKVAANYYVTFILSFPFVQRNAIEPRCSYVFIYFAHSASRSALVVEGETSFGQTREKQNDKRIINDTSYFCSEEMKNEKLFRHTVQNSGHPSTRARLDYLSFRYLLLPPALR